MDLKINNLDVFYGDHKILDDISLDIPDGSFFALLGPSGSGKSTLLKAIAGLISPRKGQIFLGDKELTKLAPHKRKAVIVFQDLRLFPHMSVIENIAFPLKMQGMSRQERLQEAQGFLDSVLLSNYAQQRVDQLSGGQQQRVALARALAAKPDILLLDEPFSSLDEDLREEMRNLVRKLHKEFKCTTILVTHDQKEALSISDSLGLLMEGKLVQQGQPELVYTKPKSAAVAEFFGNCSFIHGCIQDGYFTSSCLTFKLLDHMKDFKPGKYQLLLRPQAIDLGQAGPLQLELIENRFRGSETLSIWKMQDGSRLEIPLYSKDIWPVGGKLSCGLDLSQVVFYGE